MTNSEPTTTTNTDNLSLTQRVILETRALPPTSLAVELKTLDFSYGHTYGTLDPEGEHILQDVNMELERGSRCLLVGANGAGKTTLLRILAGKTLCKKGVRVLGNNPFFEKTPVGSSCLAVWANLLCFVVSLVSF
jgi:CCR4-NOT complex subunit CAF16